MQIRRGDVYLAQFAAFPHEQGAAGKERPVIVIQNEMNLKLLRQMGFLER
jgi:mRNA-degrading endonuclease toxin of MazEF toxin-antitoxin module